MKLFATLVTLGCVMLSAQEQEASAGFEVNGTTTVQSTYSHQSSSDPLQGAFRAVLYPTIKLNENWAITGAVQVASSPFFYEQLNLAWRHSVKTDLLQGNLSYSRYGKDKSLVVRVGQLSSAFGSFLLRYDDAANPLIDIPNAYGYYYDNVTTKGLAGVEVDATVRKLDVRAQFTNSSPANARSIFDRDQYGAFTAGGGYTIRQGFRVGTSFYRGAYLDRHYPFFFHGEANPRDLPGTGFGLDAKWGSGPWNVNGEWHYFHMDYHVIPTFTTHDGYVEVKRTFGPRWYGATRLSYQRASAFSAPNTYEFAVGYRPNARQLIKVGYEVQQSPNIRGTLANVLGIQLVTTLKPLSLAWK